MGMRRVEQRRILELLQTLTEANAEMEQLFSRGETAPLVGVLADSQNFAVQVGEYIERIAGSQAPAVALLEEYCEALYALSLEINAGGAKANFAKRLQKILVRVESSVRVQLKPDRIEVAFLPYNRAMSDALESVWQAALQDPQCDAYIIPIPYYNKYENHSLGPMQYEGDLFPKDLPITDWRAYDLQARHPDVIFIMYPYDNDNRITTLDPAFYSERLKDCCDLLAYVPYFVSLGDAVKPVFCYAQGALNADKVFVQSRAVRQKYIELLEQLEKEQDSAGLYGNPRDKYIALGSPKFDAVRNAKPEDFTLPEAWCKHLKRPDGTRKKAVFYNTTIDAMLHKGERYLENVRRVLRFFKGRDDVVLWWRPHPLYEAAFEAMRPHLLREYEQLVEDYKREDFGIYDDTPELARAVACTDAYFGDLSSVVDLYRATGKGVFMPQQPEGNEQSLCASSIFFLTSLVYQNALYSALVHKNVVLKTDLNTLQTRYLDAVPGQNPFGINLYHHCIVLDGKAVWVPFHSDTIAAYTFDSGAWELHPLCLEQKYMLAGEGKFYNIVVYKGKWFLIPFTYRAIVCYYPQTGETEHCLDLSPLLPQEEDQRMFHQYAYLNESTILLPSVRSNKVLEFNLDTYAYKVHKLGPESRHFISICKYKDAFWLLCRNRLKLIKWVYESNSITEYGSFPSGCALKNPRGAYFTERGTVLYHNRLVCLPAHANMAVECNLDTGLIRKLDAFDRLYAVCTTDVNFSWTNATVQSGNMVYTDFTNERFVSYNIETEELCDITDFPPEFSDADVEKINDNYLNAMLEGYTQMPNTDVDAENLNANAGQAIYEYVKKQVLG